MLLEAICFALTSPDLAFACHLRLCMHFFAQRYPYQTYELRKKVSITEIESSIPDKFKKYPLLMPSDV